MAEGWTNCTDCGDRYKWTDGSWHQHRTLCCECVHFKIDIGPMDWRLFQVQRRVLIELSADNRLTEQEQAVLSGLLHLTDHIVDTAKEKGRPVPDLDEVVLDMLADV